MTSAPRISVVIPCRNMGKFVGPAIDSALAQSFPAHEIIVVDDGSVDETLSILGLYQERVRVIKGPGKGSAIARNLGILAASGDHIAFLDADDLWMPAKLERQIASLREDRGFIFTDYYRSEDPSEPGDPMLPAYTAVSEGFVFSNLLRENFVSTPSVLVRKDLFARAGIFNPVLIGGQDFDLWLRLAKHTQFGWIREPLVFMRKHVGNITSSVPYPYYHARVWEEILMEHGVSEPHDRAYMQQRYGRSLYDAGRHAIRHMDRPMARRHLAKACLRGRHRLPAAAWYLMACMPDAFLGLLLRAKRRIARRRVMSSPPTELQGT